MAPVLHMSARKGITDLSSVNFTPGVPMFRSWIILGNLADRLQRSDPDLADTGSRVSGTVEHGLNENLAAREAGGG